MSDLNIDKNMRACIFKSLVSSFTTVGLYFLFFIIYMALAPLIIFVLGWPLFLYNYLGLGVLPIPIENGVDALFFVGYVAWFFFSVIFLINCSESLDSGKVVEC